MSEMEAREPEVYVAADNVFSPIGKTTAENFVSLREGISGVKQQHDASISPLPFFASLFGKNEIFIGDAHRYTKFEQLLIASATDAIKLGAIDPADKKTVLIVSSTKGNISLLEDEKDNPGLTKRVALATSAKLVSGHFGFVNTPIVISNACISGVVAILTGMRLLRADLYETAVITGADVISKFIVSGFESFKALSPELCKPFDKDHIGLNLGEGAATIILSTNKKYAKNIKVKGGAVSNDANHISGPSRTGKELADAINKAIADADITGDEIDFISAHGTATVYNDEMEASAINLAGLQAKPSNSLKGFYGHTLGAAGLIESIISLQSLREGFVLPTKGFEDAGEAGRVNVSSAPLHIEAQNFLKTASGFGGCNAAVVFGK